MSPLNNTQIFVCMRFLGEGGLRIFSYSQRGLGPSIICLPGQTSYLVEIPQDSGSGVPGSSLVPRGRGESLALLQLYSV